jgi:hypothetical protein
LEDAGTIQGFEIGKEVRELQDWNAHYAKAPHPTPPTNDDTNVPIARFINGKELLNSNNILHDGLQVENDKNTPNKDLADTRTFLVVPVKGCK